MQKEEYKTAVIKQITMLAEWEKLFIQQNDEVFARITKPSIDRNIVCDGSDDGFGCYFLKIGQPVRIVTKAKSLIRETTIVQKISNKEIVLLDRVKVERGDLIIPVENWREKWFENFCQLYKKIDAETRLEILTAITGINPVIPIVSAIRKQN